MIRSELDVVRAAASWLMNQSAKHIESSTCSSGNTEMSISATNDDAVQRLAKTFRERNMNAAELSEMVRIVTKSKLSKIADDS